MIEAARRRSLFGQRSARRRTLPFAAVLLLALALDPLEPAPWQSPEAWLALTLAVGIIPAIWFVPWARLPDATGLLPLLLFLVVVALLRDAHGGAASGYAPLALVPLLWAGAFGRWRDLAAVAAAGALTLGLPILISGAPDYPTAEVRRALLTTLVGTIAAVGISLLLRALTAEIDRRETLERALDRLCADEVHDDIVQNLTAAQLGLALGERQLAQRALAHALTSSQHVVSTMLRASGADTTPGTHRRQRPPAVSPAGESPRSLQH